MSSSPTITGEYKFGFVTEIETDAAPKGLNEDIIRFISKKNPSGCWNTACARFDIGSE
jgi:Fe-S cluster assembly protein SufB